MKKELNGGWENEVRRRSREKKYMASGEVWAVTALKLV